MNFLLQPDQQIGPPVKMSVKILSITLLLLSMCVCCHSSEAHRLPAVPRPCCTAVTKRDLSTKVMGQTYREQAASGRCVKAIIFNTKEGQLCADPNAQWVKDLIAKMIKVNQGSTCLLHQYFHHL
ncbi:monocyte chemotactic protein 1B-like isoform X1 [Simochromis diagramma]|uniref:monocyte chemotactic protein 1B-like isoform X1 n=1 Tax=Simochromis diagramma TaxID=43689 RepID=UPI001A7E7284|nr:monocyte chemotactic protein 1B-like isoform X1 [Simochromis diagramma]